MIALTSGNVSSNPSHTIIAVTNSVSALVCLLAVILVFRLKLYKKVVYRLALYQVLASLILATVAALQVIVVNDRKNPIVYGRVCVAIGWFLMYSQWMKLLFTTWVTFHLFCFAVLHINWKKLEVLYVVTSLLVPTIIAAVPLVTSSYGPSADGVICNIYANNSSAPIERYALWDGFETYFWSFAGELALVPELKQGVVLGMTDVIHDLLMVCSPTESSVAAGSAALAAEKRKRNANDEKSSELGWKCISLAVESHVCWGIEARQHLAQLASRLAAHYNFSKFKATFSLYGRLNLALVRANI
ncbi:hypothetical protein EMCRGX_G029361 [Ephydatia muelleri]